ncbi:stage III sporulation protein SpoIIIAB [Hazenella coriacea]|uniref:Stage III sporulation protein AB n=1 Tax=Hazenella coriacea TaxID=1179467 RepID=A0A4R3LB40_9BACL|nr:stage III sporulation protein SpoIIIAB [Hazenella coriacea]TCS96395.1 stage III sporulation protein AB [Hazenella coriacea]
MIAKIIGSILVVVACSAIGFQMSKRLADRPRQIRQLRSSLTLLETEIGYGTRHLSEACTSIAQREQGIISHLFKEWGHRLSQMDGSSTYECFQEVIEQCWKITAMGKAEKSILLSLCQTLGMSDRENQLHHLHLTKTNLEVEEDLARDEQARYEKMYKSMGLLTGILLAILLI